MTEQRAEEEGLSFTGIYSSDKEKVKARIKEERKERPKARIVLVWSPSSKLSRGSCSGGWSAYADETKYSAYDTIERATKFIDGYTNSINSVKRQYDEKIAKIIAKHAEVVIALKEAKEILN